LPKLKSEIPWLRLIGSVWLAGSLGAADTRGLRTLAPETIAEFDRYVRLVEAKLDASANTARYLWADTAEKRAALRRGAVRVSPASPAGKIMKPVSGGLIHDWAGAVFVPGATLDRVLAFVRDYDRHHQFYVPEVIRSRTLENKGDQYTVYLRLKKRKGGVVVVLDTVHDVVYQRAGPGRWNSRSRSTKINEVRQPHGQAEQILEPGKDHGYLWRLNSYWRFTEADKGVYIECEAVSLTREIPKVVSVIVPVIRDLPKEALENTLKATRAALAGHRR
jgi:hypothetical protein